jgi:hypothetical protein
MNQWQPMTDEDWEWVNYGKLPDKLPKQVDTPVKTK